jgi:hypothetical protein
LLTDERVLEVQEKLNNRPRERFGFLTPNEVYLPSINCWCWKSCIYNLNPPNVKSKRMNFLEVF